MKADLRISSKDFHSAFARRCGATSRGKTLKVLLVPTPFGPRQFFVRMNGHRWPATGQPVSLTRVVTAWRKALVKSYA